MWLLAALLLATVLAGSGGQMVFVSEPPARVYFSNRVGARVRCAVHAEPPPALAWLADDGAPLHHLPGLRETLANGTLWLAPFASAQYRADVHAAAYRCRAASAAGVLLSRDVRVQAVMDEEWEARVSAVGGGGAALLRCEVPRALRQHTTVTRWFRDGAPLPPAPPDSGRYVVAGARGDVLVVRGEERAAFSCEALHLLTGDKRRSAPAAPAAPHPAGTMAPRVLAATDDETVEEGADVRLACLAVGSPPPAYSWLRAGRPAAGAAWQQVAWVRGARAADAGAWTCRAHNRFGEQRRDLRLRVRTRLLVSVHPPLQIANSGSSVQFKCSVEGAEGGEGVEAGPVRVRWTHDGVPVGGGERVLRVHGVARAHRGIYQCFAERDHDSAQAAAELRLGDTAPELQYTFIEQALHAGPAVALRCAASGSPAPRFTWLLDDQPLDDRDTPHRSISETVSPAGDVVSYLNLSAVRADDGGRYTCRAHNSRGVAQHSARLNVYGPPSIRGVSGGSSGAGAVRAVAGRNTTVRCPYSGYPISEIRWSRGGVEVGAAGGRALAGPRGELLLWPAEPGDAGLYTCRVTAPDGRYAQKDIQIFVRNPPKIAGFSFPSDLVEGSSVQVLCGITSGDKPVYFSWLKDGQAIPSSLQVQEKSLEEFSFLIFSSVRAQHSGAYTCVATNAAAAVNHTATLHVKVGPSWQVEPQDVSVVQGAAVLLPCAARGYPHPTLTWLKEHGSNPPEWRAVSGVESLSVLANGSLSAAAAARHHEARYMCRAENGVGRGISKIVTLSVNEPAQVEYSTRNVSVRRGGAVSLRCAARGDPPLRLHWTHDSAPLQLNTYRVSVSEKRSEQGASSELSIAQAQRGDSGVYRCRAENAFGRDELLLYLAVQEFPEAPRGLRVERREGRAAVVSWRRGFDGNAPLRAFRLQYRVVTARLPADWTLAPTRDLPADLLTHREEEAGGEAVRRLEYRVEGLRPATAYALRLAALNDIGDSDYSDPVLLNTLEEAPSEAPRGVEVFPDMPGEILVKWQAPNQESWNGELLGYAVWCRGENVSLALSVWGWGAGSARVGPLAAHARYEITVRAFNAVGAGPSSPALHTTTLEDVPEGPPQNVRCEALSSQSLRVWWEAPPADQRAGLLVGYEVSFKAVRGGSGVWERRRAGGGEALVSGLRAGNYSLRVAARSAAGLGPPAHLHCATLDDIPGPPADVKVFPASGEALALSWLPPLHPNGLITHYRIYTRPQRAGRSSEVVAVSALQQAEEQHALVAGLQPQLYELWVTAATSAAEGDMSTIVAAKPTPKGGTKMLSFPRRISVDAGSRVVLPCAGAGAAPLSRVWARRRPPPPHADPRIRLEGHALVIPKVETSLADNYTCTVRNRWGEDHGSWELLVTPPPAKPQLRLASASPTSLVLAWDSNGAESYSLEYVRGGGEVGSEGVGVWRARWVWGAAGSVALRGLACGSRYRVRLRARAGQLSTLSDVLHTATPGALSKAALDKHLISVNSSCVTLNLLSWDCNGCPLLHFIVSVRALEGGWRSRSAALGPLAWCALPAASWHQLRVVATTTAGVTTATYYFATLTETGERIPAPAHFPAGTEEGGVGPAGAPALLAAAAALLTALLLLAVIAYKRSSRRCLEKGYEASRVSEDKSVEKRDNRRNCQQVYTSSPINTKKDQELYEISPYATFSMSSGAVCSEESASGSTLRTFGRAEPAPLSAAPPPRAPHPPHLPHPPDSEEYLVSHAMTLVVRRGDSDSESSGSPCAECAAPAYRLARTHNSEEVSRGVTDSSAESCASCPRASRRRPRRHAPHTTRYGPRGEQERRDFTIHV